MHRRLATIGLAAATLGLGLAACDSTSSGTSRLSIKLTDAPPEANITEAVVTISKIYLQGSQSANPSEQMVLLSTPVTTDLLTLSNDVLNLVEDQVVKAGTYAQLRFVIDGGYIVVDENGTSKTYATPGYAGLPEGVTPDGLLECPSCGQSGIKVNFPDGALTLTEDKIVLVDFDVAETFGHPAGGSGSWVMHPSLKADNVQLSGTVTVMAKLDEGVTLPDLNGSPTTLADFKAELRTSDMDPLVVGELADFSGPDADGYFTATFDLVLPGDYDVNILSPMDMGTPLIDFMTDPAMPQGVTVDSDGNPSVSYLITSAALPSP